MVSMNALMKCILSAISLLLALLAPLSAREAYPSRAITLIVPFPAGGSTDAIGRIVADELSHIVGQPVVVENRSGAGGSIGTAAIANAPPDGYTIGVGTTSTLAINPATYKNLPFNVPADITPIGNIAEVPNIMSVNPSVPAADLTAFIALAREQPGRLSYASAGIGSVSHLLGEQFKLATGTDITHVPYRGVAPALNDVVAGHVEVMYDNLPTTLPLVQVLRLRPLAVSGAARTPALPDVPTFAELGLDEMNWMAFFGLIGPKNMPADIVGKLNEALRQTLAAPAVRDRLLEQQARVIGNAPEAFGAEIVRELARMRRAVASANIQIE
ncbi:MAG: Bug family tripartite tricarboxylate transporter substrate binding protein [Xanthobacteraceae bacterium]